MAVNEVLRALGGWGAQFSPDIPKDVWESLSYYGHIAIHPGPVDHRVAGDSLLQSARYVGVLRKKSDRNAEMLELGGPGMAMWLGDEEGKGSVIESVLSISAQPFGAAIRLILPPATSAILEGSYFTVPGTFTGSFQWVSQREALTYLTDTMGADWKVLGTGVLNAGPEGSLFVTTPKTLVVRNDAGLDMALRGFPGAMATEQDVEDFSTRVVLLADNGSGSVATAAQDISPALNPYKDIHGATVKMTRLIQESSTDFTNAPARAQLQLNRFTSTRDAITLSTEEYDVRGDVEVGDYIWVYDPAQGVFDFANEVMFRNQRLNPMKLRLTELSWPIKYGMYIHYRDPNGAWIDLTSYLIPETGDTSLTVGGFNKSLSDGSNGGIGTGPLPPGPNLTIPGAPTWVTPFVQGSYQSTVNGETKSQVQLAWQQPLNLDSTAIADGDYYEIRYRSSTTPLFTVTHAQIAVFTHAQLASNGGTFGQPIQYPVTDWQYQRVPFTVLKTIIYELTPSMPYEAQIRVVDNGTPSNAGAWSTLVNWQTAADTIAPSTPAAPELAGNPVSVQVLHRLGKNSGGTFNLERDLHHLEIHAGNSSAFVPDESTRIGRLIANWGMIAGAVPVVGTFTVDQVTPLNFKVIAVDTFGNKSGPSPSAVVTADLIDDAHITNLTVSKVTAGTMTASWVMAGSFVTGAAGPRAGFDVNGFFAENSVSHRTFQVESATGNTYLEGTVTSGVTGQRVTLNPTATVVPEIWFENDASGRHAYINSVGVAPDVALGMNSGPNDAETEPTIQTTILLRPTRWTMFRNTIGTNFNRGGYIEGNVTDVRIGTRDNTSFDTYLRMEKAGGSWYLTGRFAKLQQDGGRSALYVDQIVGLGTSATASYGATMVSVPLPFIEIQGTSGSPPTASNHAVTARSATGFSIQFPSGNCDIFIWAIRTD
jgi:hypothetical protein